MNTATRIFRRNGRGPLADAAAEAALEILRETARRRPWCVRGTTSDLHHLLDAICERPAPGEHHNAAADERPTA